MGYGTDFLKNLYMYLMQINCCNINFSSWRCTGWSKFEKNYRAKIFPLFCAFLRATNSSCQKTAKTTSTSRTRTKKGVEKITQVFMIFTIFFRSFNWKNFFLKRRKNGNKETVFLEIKKLVITMNMALTREFWTKRIKNAKIVEIAEKTD